MADTRSNSVVVTTPLPVGADADSGSQNAGPALEVIRSLRPVLELMNIYFYETEWHYDIRPNMKWDVVLARTAEVGEIIIDNTEATPPAAHLYIARSLAGACLFPNLARLRLIDEPLHSSLSHLPLFCSPRLHSLEIDNISQDDIPGLEFFLRDPDLQVSLRNVILGPLEYSSRILQAISQCRSVEIATFTFLSSKPLGQDAILWLRAMPNLQSLTIKADHVPYTSSGFGNAGGGFAALRDIWIIGVYSFIEAILTAIMPYTAICTLNATISSDWATESPSPFCPPRNPWGGAKLPPKIETLLSLIAKEWPHSLCDFTLTVNLGAQGIISSHPTLRRECIVHLTKLQGLQRLALRGFHLDGLDHFLQTEITKLPGRLLWPNIKDVQFPILPQNQETHVQTTIKLSTFYCLVRRCRNLVSFGGLITLCSFAADSLSREFDKNPIPSGLKLLSTGSLEATDWNCHMIRVARFLDKLCPCLDKLTTHPEFSPSIWDNISGIITALKEARREEREAVMASLGAT